jgi:uncharacterized protein YkwD
LIAAFLTVAMVCAPALLSSVVGGAADAATPPASPNAPASATTPTCPGANLRPGFRNAAAVDAATLCLIDAIRAAHQLQPLRINGELGAVAASQVRTMVRVDYFADDRPSGQTPLSLIGVTRYPAHSAAIAVGQNIAWGTLADATPAHIVAEWMASRPHRAVILTGEYRDAGVAVVPRLPGVLRVGSSGATYAVEFADRRY